MSLEIYGLILLVGLFFFICVGFPISFTLITLGVVFGYIGLGPKVFHLMTFSFFGTMMDTVLAAVALFTFMGCVLESAGLMERLFRAVLLISGRLRGSLYYGDHLHGDAVCRGHGNRRRLRHHHRVDGRPRHEKDRI